jgi:hypothetical protein
MGRDQLIQGAAGFVKKCSAGLKRWLLPEQGDTSAGMEANFPVVRLILAGQEAQQRRFADSVRPNQADPIANVKLKLDIGKQWPFIKTAGQAGTAQ